MPTPTQRSHVVDSSDNEVIKNGEMVELNAISTTGCVVRNDDKDDYDDYDKGLGENQLAVSPPFVPNCELNGSFLSSNLCFNMLSEPIHVFRRIPIGNKSNVALVVRHS